MIEYQIRVAGLSHDQNLANQEALINAFGKWKPEEGLTVHAFLSNLANGGYVLVEAAEPGVVLSFVSKFIYWNDVEVVPVVDVAEAVTTSTSHLRGPAPRRAAETLATSGERATGMSCRANGGR